MTADETPENFPGETLPPCPCDCSADCCNGEPMQQVTIVPLPQRDDPELTMAAALLVYEVTLFIAIHWLRSMPPFLAAQIEAARQAYAEATGEKSMIPDSILSNRPTCWEPDNA